MVKGLEFLKIAKCCYEINVVTKKRKIDGKG